MTSEVSIINRALEKIGAEPITDRADDSKRARAANRHFDLTRDLVLVSHPWNFAIKRARIAADTNTPAWGYDNAFPLPTDCLKVIEVDGETDWRVEAHERGGAEVRAVLANAAGPLDIRYIARITDTTLYSPQFVDALATLLAAELAYELAANRSLAADLRAAFERGIRRAALIDAQEGTPDPEQDPSWITARI